MKNREKYAKEIMNVACNGDSIAVIKKSGRVFSCNGTSCCLCLFRGAGCKEKIRDWAESEYVEPVKISKRDRTFLDYLEGYKYMARDKNGDLYAYTTIPIRTTTCWRNATCINLCSLDIYFPMVKWSDEALWVIDNLKKLEVVDEY